MQLPLGVKRIVRETPCPICKQKIIVVENQNLNLKAEKCGCGLFKRRLNE